MENQFKYKKPLSYYENKLGYFIFVLAYLVLTITSKYVCTVLYKNLPIVQTLFGGDVYLEHFFVIVLTIAFIIFAFRRKLNFSIIPALLLCRTIVLMINVFFVLKTTPLYILTRECNTFCAVLVFMFGYNFISKEKTELKVLATLLSLILSVQLITTFILGDGEKAKIFTSLGLHNYASTFLTVLVAYLLFSKTDILAKLVCALSVVAIVLSQSFGGIVVIGLILLFYLVKTLNWKSKRTYLYLGIGVLVLAGFVALLATLPAFESIWDMLVSKFTFLFSGNVDGVGTGRVTLFKFSWENIRRNFFWGILDNYNPDPAVLHWEHPYWYFNRLHHTTHNHFLESMLLYGLIGTIFNVTALALVFVVGFKRCKQDKSRWAIFYALIFAVIYGVFEPNFLTADFTLIFWVFAGALTSPIKTLRENFLTDVFVKYDKLV